MAPQRASGGINVMDGEPAEGRNLGTSSGPRIAASPWGVFRYGFAAYHVGTLHVRLHTSYVQQVRTNGRATLHHLQLAHQQHIIWVAMVAPNMNYLCVAFVCHASQLQAPGASIMQGPLSTPGQCHHPALCSTKNAPTCWTGYPWGRFSPGFPPSNDHLTGRSLDDAGLRQ